MRAVGRVALTAASALAFMVALIPALAVIMLGVPGIVRLAAEPAIVRAAIASLQAAAITLAAGWPAGVLAAFGIWGARPAPRRAVLGSALLAIVVAAALPGHDLATPAQVFIPPAAAAAALVLLVLTGVLNRLDPRLLDTAAAFGATRVRAWLTILAALRPMLMLTAAAAFSLGLALCPGTPYRPTLAGLLRESVRQADVAVAPEALMLGVMSFAPLLLAGLLLSGRALKRA